jgi:hypothetical protein
MRITYKKTPSYLNHNYVHDIVLIRIIYVERYAPCMQWSEYLKLINYVKYIHTHTVCIINIRLIIFLIYFMLCHAKVSINELNIDL